MKNKAKKLNIFRNVIVNLSIVAIVLFFTVYALASSSVQASASLTPVYKGNHPNKVSLMVNVYWGNEHLDKMLEIFAKKNVKTTFFLGGSWVRDNEPLARKIIEQNHEIGNHGFFHKDHKKIDAKRNREEILATHNLVKSAFSQEMKLFMPPSGSFSDVTLEIASETGYTTIMWSKDTIDWRDQDSEVIFKRATKNISGGDLVLMHPTQGTANVLEKIIVEIEKKGLSVAPVSQVIGYVGEKYEQNTRI